MKAHTYHWTCTLIKQILLNSLMKKQDGHTWTILWLKSTNYSNRTIKFRLIPQQPLTGLGCCTGRKRWCWCCGDQQAFSKCESLCLCLQGLLRTFCVRCDCWHPQVQHLRRARRTFCTYAGKEWRSSHLFVPTQAPTHCTSIEIQTLDFLKFII